jgi:nucleotide sugar dehydrogenase
MSKDMRNLLIEGRARMGVWGCGYIGYTSIVNFANEGVCVVGHDVSHDVIRSMSVGEISIPNLAYWIGFPVKPLVDNNMIQGTANWEDMLADDIRVHLIAIPTEKDGEPWHEPLADVMKKLAKRTPTSDNPDLVIIESTLTPGLFDSIVLKTLADAGKSVGQDFLVGIAPRRDWFDSPEKSLKALARVIGGTDPDTTETMREVLGIVCDHLIPATDHRVAEMVKSVENSILHVCATYATQLACAYPDLNITEVLKLAATHWRIPLYYPSMGTGGYCIPVSSKYVKDGALHPVFLKLIEQTLHFDQNQPYFVADLIAKKASGSNIGILGLTYKRDLKVHILSPALGIIERLKAHGLEVRVHDPYYTAKEVNDIVGIDTFRYPEDLAKFDGLVIVPPHRVYAQTPKNVLLGSLRSGQVILDNEGAWEKWRDDMIEKGIDYHRVGDKGWLQQS